MMWEESEREIFIRTKIFKKLILFYDKNQYVIMCNSLIRTIGKKEKSIYISVFFSKKKFKEFFLAGSDLKYR